ncbi:EAL domain-containing protein [Sulfuritalea sp.]|uniref:putative bifunctional diguanylate cyclase/phosphodiesterase n=1 Tax=Sulfuritalea sp. TaxID=2480090 RepID=UPI00286E6B11|nr:EAL domain-containing protein [Sulfuritalea sp.]
MSSQLLAIGSIRARLVLGFAVLLGLLFAVAAVPLQRLEDLTARTRDIVDRQAQLAILSQRANQHSQAAAIGLLNLMQTAEREARVPLYAAMDAELAAADSAVAGLEMAMLTPALRADVERLTDLRRRYGELFQTTVELIEIEGSAPARRHFEDRTQKVLNTLLFETQALEARLQQAMQAELEELRQAATNARRLVIILALGALAAGAVMAWAIARSIVGPVREAVAVAERIAGGDYQAAIPAGRRDEIGALMGSLATMRDSIASREERISRLAYVDLLTGLPNRTRFLEILGLLPAGSRGAVFMLGIDRFAPINNALGHAIGDSLLCEIAARLCQAQGGNCVLARLWGDEFVMLLEDADQPAAARHAERVLAALRAPMIVEGQRLDIDASIGIALYPRQGESNTALLRRADLAMASAKRRHAGSAFSTGNESEPPHEELSLIGEMREALARGEFLLHYQPKLHLAQGRIASAEALVRWRHPDKGMIAPGGFIPFAEQTGFIREITPWVLARAIADAARWRRDGIAVVVSANLSALDLLNRDLVDLVRRLLDESALPADRLCLEITESALMDEPELALQHLDELAALGVKLSIDDYGSGQASLAYVKTLPVHELKIDRAFVDGVDTDSKNAAIVRSTILLCRELGLTVVAEGAETPAELAWLRTNGCDLVQGYVVARPMPLEDFLARIRDYSAA